MDSLTNGLASIRNGLDWLPDPIAAVLIILLAAGAALLLHRSLRILARRTLSRRYPTVFSFVTQMRGLSGLALLIVAMIIAVWIAPIAPLTKALLAHILLMAIIVLIGWSIMMALHIGATIYLRRFSLDSEDNLLARKHYPQVRVLLRSADVL